MIVTVPNTAPVTYERCPNHRQLVAFDGEGKLLGQCSGCAAEVAQAILDIDQGVARAHQRATATLDRIGRRR